MIVSRVAPNTPATRASLHEGDQILSINNIDIEKYSHEEVREKMYAMKSMFFSLSLCQVVDMIRQSRERPLGELELLIRPLKNCRLSPNNDTDSEGAYDNDLLNSNSPNPLEQSLETLRNDLTSGHSIEQYEVSSH